MPELDLEWSSPIGPAELAWLAGPWRRAERSAADDDHLELFRARPTAAPVTGPRDPSLVLATAPSRLRAALDAPGGPLARAEALLHALKPGPDPAATLADLSRRAAAPARVETLLGERAAIVTDLGITAAMTTRLLVDTPGAALDLHHRAVAAALRTRVTLVHTTRTTLGLAAAIVALAGPAAAALAVPLAWRFLHGLLAEHAASQGH